METKDLKNLLSIKELLTTFDYFFNNHIDEALSILNKYEKELNKQPNITMQSSIEILNKYSGKLFLLLK